MFTETYIEMVINNKQIQGLCKYKKGDWFYAPNTKQFDVIDIDLKSVDYPYYREFYKWLPTLEDLFVMVDIKNGKDFDKSSNVMWDENAFGEIVINPKYGNCNDLHSMILILVMEMNYNKSWNPNKKEWEEINGS